jgi:hypothetical protein
MSARFSFTTCYPIAVLVVLAAIAQEAWRSYRKK